MSTFVMTLSPFDCSHKTGVQGTPEVLIPQEAGNFFPPVSLTNRAYPDAYFNVMLSTPNGQQQQRYRIWEYAQRAIGTPIGELRLRMNHATIDLAADDGAILAVTEMPAGTTPKYQVNIVNPGDPNYAQYLTRCNRECQRHNEKRWGIF